VRRGCRVPTRPGMEPDSRADVPLAMSPSGASAKEAMFLGLFSACALQCRANDAPPKISQSSPNSANQQRRRDCENSLVVPRPGTATCTSTRFERPRFKSSVERLLQSDETSADYGKQAVRRRRVGYPTRVAHKRFHKRKMKKASSGVDNTTRRKWNKDEYTAKAAERERVEDEKFGFKKPSVPAGAIVERKELNVASIIQRDYKKELEARVGTKTLVNLDTGEGLGFKCKESGVILKDSMAYLDHINGKKQQKALGMSMVVERSSVEQVKNAFVNAKRKKQEAKVRGFSTQHVPPP
jgi:hypothetical protein